jgi:hypothetical protein
MESLGLQESDKSWRKCSFKFELNKRPAVLSTEEEFAVKEDFIMVCCKESPRR